VCLSGVYACLGVCMGVCVYVSKGVHTHMFDSLSMLCCVVLCCVVLCLSGLTRARVSRARSPTRFPPATPPSTKKLKSGKPLIFQKQFRTSEKMWVILRSGSQRSK
jgi:hypothetical protein